VEDAGGALANLSGRLSAPGASLIIGLAADLVITLSLLAFGSTLAIANLTGFIAGGGIGLATAARWPRTPSASERSRRWSVVPVLRLTGLAALGLGLRGGAMATLIALGSPTWFAVIGGAAIGWIVCAIGVAFYVHPQTDEHSPASRWTLAATGIVAYVLLLRLLTMKVLGVMPQEAYYWNYSIRPDFGYHDHPPMVAWLIALGEVLFGQGTASVRLGGFVCGVVVIIFAYVLALRLVDRSSAMVAAALAAVLPYFFVGAGMMMTPDAPLAAAWAAALYYFHRALVGGERAAWLGVGAAIGFGLLSKYTIALLGPAALVFCALDPKARRWLARPEPYLAILLALALFAPVIYWNYAHDWASFAFQTEGRFGSGSRFSLHRLLANMLVVATPLPFMALPLLFVKRWTDDATQIPEPEHAQARNRLFVACFVFVPLAVFAWDALKHLPRLNWTGPIWLATLPMVGWAIVHAAASAIRGLGTAMRITAPHLLGGLLAFYALCAYYFVVGFPGIGYPASLAAAMGWPEAARQLSMVQRELARETGAVPVVVGMDSYQIASMLSFYGTPQYLAAGDSGTPAEVQPLRPTAMGELFGGEGLMFAYWYPPRQFAGRDFIMLARHPSELTDGRLTPYFRSLDPKVHPLPLISTNVGGIRNRIDSYFYRVGYGYRPAPPGQ
jgi:dolichol-phosphate mannosyltransferase